MSEWLRPWVEAKPSEWSRAFVKHAVDLVLPHVMFDAALLLANGGVTCGMAVGGAGSGGVSGGSGERTVRRRRRAALKMAAWYKRMRQGLAETAQNALQRIVNPRFLSKNAACDVLSIFCQALACARRRRRRGKTWKWPSKCLRGSRQKP